MNSALYLFSLFSKKTNKKCLLTSFPGMKQNPGQFVPQKEGGGVQHSSTKWDYKVTRLGLGLQIVAFLLASILGREHHLRVLLHLLVALPKHSIQCGLYPRNITKYDRMFSIIEISYKHGRHSIIIRCYNSLNAMLRDASIWSYKHS